MAPRSVNELTGLIKNLRTVRREHELALKEIEDTFRQIGLEHLLDGSAPRKRAAAAPLAGKPARGKAASKGGNKRAAKTTAAAKSKAGAKSKGAGRRKRAKYAQTADEFILSFLAKHKSATTSEIRQYWQKQGRGGKAENSLTGLVKSGKVIRTPRPGEAGSSYSLPTTPSSTPTA
jgi:hypothetical protein